MVCWALADGTEGQRERKVSNRDDDDDKEVSRFIPHYVGNYLLISPSFKLTI